MRSKGDGDSEDGAVQQDDGFGFWIWGVSEVVNVTIGTQAADDGGTRRGVNGVALGPGGDFAVVADADAGLLTPDVRPPGTVGRGADDGLFFGESLLLGLERGLAEFAMDFMLVGVRNELVQEVVGPDQFDDALSGQEGHEAFLPVVVAAFNFAFGLRRWRVEEVDAVEVEGLTELGEGVGVVGVEEGVVVHVEDQGQAVSLEDTGKEVEVGQEGFTEVETCAGVEAGGVIEDVQQDLLVGAAGQPGVRAGVVLPKRAVVAGLPAFDGLGDGLGASVRGELMFEGPAPDTGAVGFEVEAAQEFTGGGAIGGGWFGGEEFGEESRYLGGPSQVVIAPGHAGRPDFSTVLSAGFEIVAVESVEVRARHPQFLSGGPC